MKIISMVPSITETLFEAMRAEQGESSNEREGALSVAVSTSLEIVGRTRFCIHPEEVLKVPAIGGTKDLNWEKLKELEPDLLILDKEENLPWMATEAPCKVLIAHVDSIETMIEFARTLSSTFPRNSWLKKFSERWSDVQAAPNLKWDWQKIPGSLEVWGLENLAMVNLAYQYVIWKEPWMTVGRQTFIHSVLTKLGAGELLREMGELTESSEVEGFNSKYPKILDSEFTRENLVSLFSSEPFPFEKFKAEIRSRSKMGALVDGESYSWFGVRSLLFLESELGI